LCGTGGEGYGSAVEEKKAGNVSEMPGGEGIFLVIIGGAIIIFGS
jgi:hypothetical protein